MPASPGPIPAISTLGCGWRSERAQAAAGDPVGIGLRCRATLANRCCVCYGDFERPWLGIQGYAKETILR